MSEEPKKPIAWGIVPEPTAEKPAEPGRPAGRVFHLPPAAAPAAPAPVPAGLATPAAESPEPAAVAAPASPAVPEGESLPEPGPAAEPLSLPPPRSPSPGSRPARRETAEEEPVEIPPPGLQKLGIVGGKGVGKSYLFQALVYRTYDGGQSGALTPFLERGSISLSSGLSRKEADQSAENLAKFVDNYACWRRLGQTTLLDQRWYRLRLPYRTGLLGQRRGMLEVELFDGSGEGFFEALRSKNDALWREGYLDAGVMVFCLPLWAVFPRPDLSDEDVESRDGLLRGFAQVVENYRDLRRLHRQERPVRSILALTMADDPRSSLAELRERWIEPYMAMPKRYLRTLRKESGVMRYLVNAQQVSALLLAELAAAPPTVSAIPRQLDFNGGLPWIVPLSAIEGSLLERLHQSPPSRAEMLKLAKPVPVHVELPLLVTLCEHDNALM